MTDNSTTAILPFLFTSFSTRGPDSFPLCSPRAPPLFLRAPVGEGEFLPGADALIKTAPGKYSYAPPESAARITCA